MAEDPRNPYKMPDPVFLPDGTARRVDRLEEKVAGLERTVHGLVNYIEMLQNQVNRLNTLIFELHERQIAYVADVATTLVKKG